MRSVAAFAVASVVILGTCGPGVAAEREAGSTVDAVTVYPDGATVTRIIRADLAAGDTTLVARDFPPTLDPASLRVEGGGGTRVVIASIDARPPRADRPPVNPDLENRIQALEDQRVALGDAIAAAIARRAFAERFAKESPIGLGDKGEARPLADWRAAFSAVADEIASADAAIRDAEHRRRDIDRDLEKFKAERDANPPRKMEVRIDLSADAATQATLRVSYTVRQARWQPLYDARLDTGGQDRKPSIDLIRRAQIVQHSGEDWTDVALTVSTVRTAKGGNAPQLPPLIVGYPKPRPVAPAAPTARSAAPQASLAYRKSEDVAEPVEAAESEATADAGGYQVLYRIPGRVSVAANAGAKSVRIGTTTLAPALTVRAAPAFDTTAYLEASFKQGDDAPLLPGRVSLYRDGVYVGNAAMALTPKDETVRLGFGADDKVTVARAVVRQVEGSAGLIGSSKTDEREFKISVRNGHAAPVSVWIEDRVPVSETADVQVEVLPGTTPPSVRDAGDRRGVYAWTFDAAPGEARDIRLAWRVRWPADKAIVYDGRTL